MDETDETAFDRPEDIRRTPRVPNGPRVPHPHRATWLSRSLPRHRHDVAERRRVHQGRSRFCLSRSLERGTRFEVDQDHDANGSVALQETRACPQGDLDARLGLQPDPYDHGSNGQPARNRAAIHQFQGDAPGAGGLSARDQPASTSWSRAPSIPVSTNVASHCPAPRRRSPRPLRAPHDETTAEKLQPPDKAAKGDQTRYDQRLYGNLSAIGPTHRSHLTRGCFG